MPTKLDRIISIDVLEGIASASALRFASVDVNDVGDVCVDGPDDAEVEVEVDVESEGPLLQKPVSRDRSAKVVRWWAKCLGTGEEESQ